jgi:hypothetical protein
MFWAAIGGDGVSIHALRFWVHQPAGTVYRVDDDPAVGGRFVDALG